MGVDRRPWDTISGGWGVMRAKLLKCRISVRIDSGECPSRSRVETLRARGSAGGEMYPM
jgi:hypothetical protein